LTSNDQAMAVMQTPAAPVEVQQPQVPTATATAISDAAVAPSATSDTPAAIRIWRRMRREPSLLVTIAYLFVSFIGLWANYWFYDGFGLPILEYMQASDYLVAGLRDPTYALVLLATFALIVLISAPDLYRRRHPERVRNWREKWWGRAAFPENKWLRWKVLGLAPETGVACAVIWGMLWATMAYVQNKGALIRNTKSGNAVRVTMAGASSPVPQTGRLLGSSSTFVFLWWPDARIAEAVPIESIARLQSPSQPSTRRHDPSAPAAAAPATAPGATTPPTVDKR
jgi:hypothetical protein